MKVVMWIGIVALLAIVGVGAYVVMNSGNLIKAAVETLGPEYLGVDVTLDAAELSLTEGTGELRGLVIGNPDGFDGDHAFSLGRIRLAIDPTQIGESLVVIKAIEVDAADLAIIAKGSDTNLQAIRDNLDSGGSSQNGSSEAGSTQEGGDAPKLIIDSFAFTNARTSLDSDLLGAESVSIADVNLSGIGRKSNGVTAREALKQMMEPILRASSAALAKEGLDVDELQQQAEQRLDEELKDKLGTDLNSLKKRFQ